MRPIEKTSTHLRVECSACGAENMLPRVTHELAPGRFRNEPVQGQWFACRVCRDWSPLETRDVEPAPLVGASS